MISGGFLDLEDFFVFDLLMDFYGLDMFFLVRMMRMCNISMQISWENLIDCGVIQ